LINDENHQQQQQQQHLTTYRHKMVAVAPSAEAVAARLRLLYY
jgi:hypothetical protein